MPEDKKQIAFYGSEAYRTGLQREALNRGMKVQQLLEEAVDAYLSGPQAVEDAPRRPQLAHESGDPHADKLMAAFLKMLHDPKGTTSQKIVEAVLEPWLDENSNATEAVHKRRA